MCYKREKTILKLFGNLVKQEHFSTVMKQATDCDWGLGGLNPLLKIPAGLSPKNPLFQMPSFGFHSPFPWEPPQIQLSLRGVAPDLQTAWCAVFAFQANSQGSLRKLGAKDRPRCAPLGWSESALGQMTDRCTQRPL